MVEISNVEVFGLERSARASGYPMLTSIKAQEVNEVKDYARMGKLAKVPTGSGHDNALKGVRVMFDINYPQYFTPQLQRYNFIDIISSQSKMHKLVKMDIDKSCNKYVTNEILSIVDIYKQDYIDNPSYKNFMRLLSNTPLGFELTMRISTNYLQLKTIYQQRKNHKLKEDWGSFRDMIKALPHSEWITGEANG